MQIKTKYQHHQSLNDALFKIGQQYKQCVDQTLDSKQSAENLYQEKTDYSLLAKIEETVRNDAFYQALPEKVQKNMNKTYQRIQYGIQGYERFKTNNFDHDRPDQYVRNWQNNKFSANKTIDHNVRQSLYSTEKAATIANQHEIADSHIHYVNDTSELNKGDVIEIYIPYKKPKEADHYLDRQGQNRYFTVLQTLPNGDIMAASMYGHRQLSPTASKLNYDPNYAYPTSSHVVTALDPDQQRIVQLPKEVINRASDLIAKNEAARYVKPYKPMTHPGIKVLEMNQTNKNKVKQYASFYNKNDKLDIGWQRGKEQIVPVSPKGHRMVNSYFYDTIKNQLQAGTFNHCERIIDNELHTQAAYLKKHTQKEPATKQKITKQTAAKQTAAEFKTKTPAELHMGR